MVRCQLCLIVLAGGVLFAGEPFQLKLSDLSDAWFDSGAIVRVPKDRCAQMQIKLGAPWSQQTAVESLEWTLDGQFFRATRSTGSDGHLLTIRTREPLGLLTGDEHHLVVSATSGPSLRGEWTILRWEKAYIQASGVGKQGIPIGVRIDQPPGGVILRPGNVRFRGELMGGDGARLLIQAQEVHRLAGKPGFQFDEQIAVAADAKEVIALAAEEGAGSTVLVLPVAH